MKIRPRSIDYRSQLCESISEPCFQNDLIIDGCLISDDDDDENLKEYMNPAASACTDRKNEDCDDPKSIPEYDIILPEVTKRPIKKRRKLSQKKIRPIDSEINMEEKALNFLSDEKHLSIFPIMIHAEQLGPTEIADEPTDDAFGTANEDSWNREMIDSIDSTTASTVAENVGQSQDLVVSLLQNRDTNRPFESNQLTGSFGSYNGTVSYHPLLSLRLPYCNAAQLSDLQIRRLLQNSVMLTNQNQMANFRYRDCLPMAPMNENEVPLSKCQALVVYKPSMTVQRRESQLTSTEGIQPCLTPESMFQCLYFLFMTYGHHDQNDHGRATYDASNPLEDEVPEQDVNEIQIKIQSNTVEESVFVDAEVQRRTSLKDPKLTDNSSSPLLNCENEDWHGDCDEVMETSKSDLDEKSLESNGCFLPNGDADETLSSSSPMEAPLGDEENILHEWNEHSHTSMADLHDFQPDDKADDESSWKSQSPEDDEDYPNHLNEYSYKSTQQYKQHSAPSVSPAMKTTVDFQRHRPNHNYSNGQQSTQSKEYLNTSKQDKSESQSKYKRSEKEFHNQTKHDEQKGHTKKMPNTQAEDRNNVSYSGPGENQSIAQPKKRKIGTVAENEHESLFHEDDFVGLNSGKRRLESSSFPFRESRKDSISRRGPSIDNNDPMRSVDAFEHYQQRPSITANTIIPPKVGQYLSSATTVSNQNQRAFQAAQYTLLCAESFLEKFSEAAAELCSGRWMQLQNLNERGNSPRIHLMDTSSLDEISVEIELPDFSAIAIIDSASLVHSNPTVIKDIVKRFVQLGSTGRYESVHILLSCSNMVHHHQFQSNLALLQNAIFKQPGCPCQRFSVQFVSRKTLAASIMKIAESHGLFKETIDPLNHDDTIDDEFQLQVRFLLNIAPTLTCRNALLLIRGYCGCFGQLLHDVILTTDEQKLANVLLERGIAGIREVSLRQLCCAMNVSLVG